MKSTDSARERLLTVAQDLFSKRGFDGVSIRDLTSAANANLGAVTYHFGSKEALYHAALESLAAPFSSLIADAARAPGNGLERVVGVVRSALRDAPLEAGPVACLLREMANHSPFPPPMRALMQRNTGIIRGLIEEGQRDGSIRAGDPTLLALSAISQPFYFKVAGRGLEEALGIRREDPKQWSRVVEHVATAVRRTLETREDD